MGQAQAGVWSRQHGLATRTRRQCIEAGPFALCWQHPPTHLVAVGALAAQLASVLAGACSNGGDGSVGKGAEVSGGGAKEACTQSPSDSACSLHPHAQGIYVRQHNVTRPVLLRAELTQADVRTRLNAPPPFVLRQANAGSA